MQGYSLFDALYLVLNFFCFCLVFFSLCIVAFVSPFQNLQTRPNECTSNFCFFSAFFAFQKSYMKMALSDFGENRRLRPAIAASCLLIALSLFSDALLLPVLAQRADNVS